MKDTPDHTGTGGPWGPCYMCVQVEPASGNKDDIDKANQVEQSFWNFYQANQSNIEGVYGAWGVSPAKLRKWFTPGSGPKVKAVNELTLHGLKVNGWFSPGQAIRIDNDLGSRAVGTLIHELIHKVQHRSGSTPRGVFESSGEAMRYAAGRVADAIDRGYQVDARTEFMAYWAARVLLGEAY